MEGIKKRWLIDGWKWWRYNHNYGFLNSIRRTFRSEIWIHILDIYAWFWLKGFHFKIKYMWWTKYSKLTRENEKLRKLFLDGR